MKASEAKAIADKVFNIENAVTKIHETVKMRSSFGHYTAFFTKTDFNNDDGMIAKVQEMLTAGGYSVTIGLEVITISWR